MGVFRRGSCAAGLIGLLSLGMSAPVSGADPFVVTQIADSAATDSAPGDGTCDLNPQTVEKECSLRVAIHEANSRPGADVINFNIPGSNNKINLVNGKLPAIKGPVTIDGTTEPDFATGGGKPVVWLDGSQNIGQLGLGLKVVGQSANGTVIRGLAIGGFVNPNDEGAAISLRDVTDVVIERCFLGAHVGPSGTEASGNTVGVAILRGRSNRIQQNVIASNFEGVKITASEDNRVKSNSVGFEGQTFFPNFFGVTIRGEGKEEAPGNLVKDNVILGNSEILGGNGSTIGINLTKGAVNTTVKSNQIFFHQTGVRIIALESLNTLRKNVIERNSQDGLLLDGAARANIVDNVISKNRRNGIFIRGGKENSIMANFIGTDPAETDRGNELHGISVKNSPSNLIGGEGVGNVIGFNFLDNVNISGNSSRNGIFGNVIRDSAFGNGITLRGEASSNVVGSSSSNPISAVAPNLIFLNAGHGVLVKGEARENRISENSIRSNGLLGIDLEEPGKLAEVTPNDAGDADSGPNGLQNFPEFTLSAGHAVGKLKSAPGKEYRIEFFASETCHASLHGQGEVFLKHVVVTTNSNGKAAFDVELAIPQDKPVITATATLDSEDSDVFGSTSEFSACQPLPPPPPA